MFRCAVALISSVEQSALRLRPLPSPKQSTAHHGEDPSVSFRVTHPFHPLHGREFQLVDRRQTWGEDRVYYLDEQGELRRLPASWTSAATADPFVLMSNGRSHFRVDDLLELSMLLGRCRAVPRKSKHLGRRSRTSRK